jgi:hypothetical protein
MTTATAPATRARGEFDARWLAATSGMIVQTHDGDEVYSLDMSAEFYRLEEIIRGWAIQTYGDHVWLEEDVEAFQQLTGEAFDTIRRVVVDWAIAQRARVVARAAAKSGAA